MRFTVVVLSGAGISTDSGIQDFRGPQGAWTLNPGAQRKHMYQAFVADAALRGRYWRSRCAHPVWQAEPNAGHLAVASLAGSDIDTTVITQNTDGLHQRAGTPADRVIELHGTMHETLCVQCGHRGTTTDVLARVEAGEAAPPCLRCGGILKTASTMFGQTMSPEVFARAEQAVTSCDLVLAVGTTLTIEPAGSLCATAVRAGARLVIVNLGATPYDGIASEIIREPLGEALPRLVGQLKAGGWEPVAVVATTRDLVEILAESTEEQDRQVLTELARDATTRPELRKSLIELLSVLPGLAPAAVEVALTIEHPGPLVDALTALARTAALPAELLAAIPPGTIGLGEFPVVLTESLVEAYEQRVETYPESGLRGLERMLSELSARLADLGRVDESRAAAQGAARAAAALREVTGG